MTDIRKAIGRNRLALRKLLQEDIVTFYPRDWEAHAGLRSFEHMRLAEFLRLVTLVGAQTMTRRAGVREHRRPTDYELLAMSYHAAMLLGESQLAKALSEEFMPQALRRMARQLGLEEGG